MKGLACRRALSYRSIRLDRSIEPLYLPTFIVFLIVSW